MKKTITMILAALALSITSCKKEITEPARLTAEQRNEPNRIKYGRLIFWSKTHSQTGTLFCKVGTHGDTASWVSRQTAYYSESTPSCDAEEGFAVYYLPVGRYAYRVETLEQPGRRPGMVMTAMVDIEESMCKDVEIY